MCQRPFSPSVHSINMKTGSPGDSEAPEALGVSDTGLEFYLYIFVFTMFFK